MKNKFISKKALSVALISITGFYSSSLMALECQDYSFTGAPETLVVPNGSSQAEITVIGADGGNSNGAGGIVGGEGGSVVATFAVTPGQTITSIVGGVGSNGNNAEAGGGGGSGAFLNNTALIVAGGGGGGDNTGVGQGGGQNGTSGGNATGNGAGNGGTGGNGGQSGEDGTSGRPGTGGGGGLNTDGGTSTAANSATGGGACLVGGIPTGGAGGIDNEQGGVANGGYGCGGGGAASDRESGGGGGFSGGGGAGANGAPGGGGTFVDASALTQAVTAGADGGGTLSDGLVSVCFPADVAVVKTLDTAGPYTAGQSVTFLITVSNLGPNQATNIDVTDIPTNLTIDTVSSASCSAFPCTIPSLNSGANEIITVTATIGAAGAFNNDVTVAADEDDPDTSNNMSGDGDTAVAGADVAVTKDLTTAGPFINGQTVTYNITVTNNGSLTANNINVNDTPSNLSINTVSSTNCNAFPCIIPSLANGASEIITVTASINSAGAFDNVVSVSADEPDPNLSNNSDSAGNGGTAGPAADVAVTKNLDTAGPYVASQSIQYTITVTNNGPNIANNVQVTDTPTNLSIVTVASTNCNTFPCTIPSLAIGASEIITVTATIDAGGAFDNSVTVSADETDPVLGNNTDNTGNGGNADPAADVAVIKDLDTAGPFASAQPIQYTITVTNNGPDTATNVQVVDTPTNLTINTVSSTNCNAFPCTIPSLTNGSSEIITVAATINVSGVFDNVVTVSADETDPNTGNNTDDSGNGGNAGASADVAVIKNLDTAAPYVAAQTIQYTITVSNNGPDTATNVQVVDTPTNLTIDTVSSTNCNTFPCTIPSLANGANEIITVTATIDAGGAFDNSVSVSANEDDPDTSNNTDNSGNGGNADPAADVAVIKDLDTAAPYSTGQSIQYTITVSNNGPDTATNVQVTDTPTNLTITTVSSTNCSAFPCVIPSLTNGANEIISVTATIDASGLFDNVVSVSADEDDPDNSNNTDDSGNGGSAGTSADLSVVKDLDTAGPYNPGQTVNYTITVTNNGPDTANNVLVVDTPTNLTIVTVSSPNCSAFPCTISSLVNGASEVISVSATIDSSGMFDNEVTVSADESDPNISDNTDDAGNSGNTGPAADVTVSKSISTAGPFTVGQAVDFDITVTNNGPDTANNVVITDVPSNLTITSVSSANCSGFPCTIPSLTVNASESITVTATINGTGQFLNIANVSADEFDPDPNNNDDDGSDGNNGGFIPPVIQQVPAMHLWGMLIMGLLMLVVLTQRKRFIAVK
ncbi:beta strand repeat-containing protein [Marinicella sp. W31]|uniref:beta strand repeat-containing protein n=1 Tax=Marinicella sp. W31 TaxID=3023713 RepID=UPI003756CDC3